MKPVFVILILKRFALMRMIYATRKRKHAQGQQCRDISMGLLLCALMGGHCRDDDYNVHALEGRASAGDKGQQVENRLYDGQSVCWRHPAQGGGHWTQRKSHDEINQGIDWGGFVS